MKPIGTHNYYIYITTNFSKNVLYTGLTNDLYRRMWEHKEAALTGANTFTGKYYCYYLIYYEWYQYIYNAMDREKEIKGWRREKKVELINSFNPNWNFLNDQIE